MASALQDSKKRRFQPPITSYFVPSTPETEELSHHSYAAPTNTPTPALPANILSSLLGVGARVRKSVPEGYKTEQKKLTAYMIPAPPSAAISINNHNLSEESSQSNTTTLYAELEPFCGIHKIGNYAVQTFPRPDEQYRNEMMVNDDDVSMPSGSQESNASSSSFYSNPTTSNKRSYNPDMEEEEDLDSSVLATNNGIRAAGGFVSGDIWQDIAIPSVYTSTPSHAISQRTILSPRLGQHRRRIAATAGSSWKPSHSEQENEDPRAFAGGGTTSSDDMMDLDDFGEASFLRRREEVDADYL